MILYYILRPILMGLYRTIYRVKVFGKENLVKKGRRIVVCNHQRKADVYVIGSLYMSRTMFLSKKEWFSNWFNKFVLSCLGAIPINREKPEISSIKRCLKVLKDEKRLAVFPEGTRNKVNNEIQTLKTGTALFAVKGRAPITPIIIYEGIKPFKRGYAMVGESFDLSEFYDVKFTDEVAAEATKVVEQKMKELQTELFKKVDEINAEKAAKKNKKAAKKADKQNARRA